MFFSSIDIGSNTTLLLVVEKCENGSLRIVEDHSRVTGLGRDVQKSLQLKTVAMEETLSALIDYVNICSKYQINPEDCIVTATQASRIAQNASAFFERVREKCGLKVRIISSEKEAYYTAKGLANFDLSQRNSSMIIMDIGGASTEFIRIEKKPFKMIETISLPVGSVVCHEWLLSGEFEINIEKLVQSFDLEAYRSQTLTCVAGSMTAVAGMIQNLKEFDANLINGYAVRLTEFEDFVIKLEQLSIEEINLDYPFLGKRAVTIQAGAKLALALCKEVQAQEIRVSSFGLRHGSILEAIDE